MKEIICLEGISVDYPVRVGVLRTAKIRAVDGVSISIAKGETLALVGESGSGKTTLGKVSLRLIRPDSGRIIFDGKDITQAEEPSLRWFRRMAQAVFQDPYSSLNPAMTLGEIVGEPLVVHGVGAGEREKLVYKALEDVKLAAQDFLTKYPHMLSGGQRQRTSLARALVIRPEFIVADEPVSMIDASSRAEILYLMRDLQSRYGISFLYITHDIATAKYFSDRIGVMYLGRIVELAPSKELIENPLHPYTMALMQSVPDPDPNNRLIERRTLQGQPPSPSHIPSGCRFHPRCPSFMKGVCEVRDPTWKQETKGHFVACHLY